MDKIDFLDKKILSILSKNARIPFKDVAAECNVSRAAIHQRVQHLIDADVITGSGFDVNPKSLGYTTCTYVGITLEKGSMYKDVVEYCKHIPEVVECHFTTGPYTMLVKLYARDNEQVGLSRQGVRDIVKRCSKELQDAEEKLGFLKKMDSITDRLEEALDKSKDKEVSDILTSVISDI